MLDANNQVHCDALGGRSRRLLDTPRMLVYIEVEMKYVSTRP